jgi:hypothetical protein
MDVDVLTWTAGLALVLALGLAVAGRRRRGARRAAERRALERRRRHRVPDVSANVRGLQAPRTDLWSDDDARRGQGRAP